MEEPKIIINGQPLTVGQSMTIRVALESFVMDLIANGLGDDEHGKNMAKAYKERAREVSCLMTG